MQAGSELRQAYRTAALIAGGLIASLVMYAIVANVFRTTQAPFSGMAGLPETYLRAARFSSVAGGGLAELPAVTGFVLVILGGLFLDFYLLGSLSLLLMLANVPRYDAWEEWLATPAPRP